MRQSTLAAVGMAAVVGQYRTCSGLVVRAPFVGSGTFTQLSCNWAATTSTSAAGMQCYVAAKRYA